MYKKNKMSATSMMINKSIEGETIEQKMERIINNNEPITDGAPIIFTERKDGVNPSHDIRTDRFEIAVEAMDKVSGSYKAKREQKHQERKEILDEFHEKTGKKDGGAEPTQGTE